MRRLVLYKTVLAVVSAGMLSMSILADAADAHTGFRDDWIMGTHHGQHGSYERDQSRQSYEQNNAASNNAAAVPGGMRAGNEVPLDGTYTRVQAYHPGAQKIIGEHIFILERPAEIKLHTIGKQKFTVATTIYDSDGNELCSVHSHEGETVDVMRLLSPGRYVIKHKTIGVNYNYDAEIEFKLTKEDVPNNLSQVAYHRWEAPQMVANVVLYDYIPFSYDGKKPYRYYAMDVPYSGTVTVATEKIAGRCVMDFDVVDADENVVKSWRGIFDVHEEKNYDLPAGWYFIRVKSAYSDGGAYSLKYFLHN